MTFITLEGIEGSGKTTQAQRLAKALGPGALLTQEPGGTAIGRAVRGLLLDVGNKGMAPETELLLYFADRAQHVGEVVRPALAEGRIVVSDRYIDSSMAYQGHGRGIDLDLIRVLARAATGGLVPDLTIFIDVPVAVGLARVGKRGRHDRLEAEVREFHERVRDGYRTLAAADRARWVSIDGEADEDDVARQVLAAVAARESWPGMAFDNVLGHDRVRRLVSGALRGGRLPPALLLCGPEGVGKRTLALAVARALLCESGGDGCGRCATCHRVERGLHPDVTVVLPELTGRVAAIKIEQVRDLAREIAAFPFEGRARAFVVDDANTMTEQAQNALLKSLEEPAPTSHVLLVTGAPQALLPTIRSRCQVLRFGPIPAAILERHLQGNHGLSADEARLRASLSGGSLGAALAFEADGYRAVRDLLIAGLSRLPSLGALERMDFAQKLDEADDPMLVMTALRSILRDVAALRAGSAPESVLNRDAAEALAALARGPLGARAVGLGDVTEDTRTALRQNANRLLSMDVLVDAVAG